MIVDTSALLAILFDEPESSRFLKAIHLDLHRFISAGSMLEAGIVVESALGSNGVLRLHSLVQELELSIVPVTSELVEAGLEGFRKYGKGRHRASLNFGDCFSYGLARTTGEPLLYKGNDFGLTDIHTVPG